MHHIRGDSLKKGEKGLRVPNPVAYDTIDLVCGGGVHLRPCFYWYFL